MLKSKIFPHLLQVNLQMPFETSGHYTQVVWAETSAVGCGLTTTMELEEKIWNKFTITLICNYAKSGNFLKRPVYKIGEGCSACPTGTSCDSAFDKLCA